MTHRKAAARPPRHPDKRDAPRRAERESPPDAHRATPLARADDAAGRPARAVQPRRARWTARARRPRRRG
ncbi:MarR family transcriptional regulator, partial [Burkholderia pseudomallei]